jgi:hypothetical protein
MDRLEVGTRVVATSGEDQYPGIITGRYDEDQGIFEYYVKHDDGDGSFWDRESLREA